MGKSAYHVLREITVDGAKTYVPVVANLDANSADHAVRLHAETAGQDAAGVYVAIPSRSFKPIPVSVETETRIRLGATTAA